MKKLNWVVGVLLVLSFDASAQLARNGAYFELAGSGIGASINYERQVRPQWMARIGFFDLIGTTETDTGNKTEHTFVFPATMSWVSHPTSNHHLEVGGGLTFVTGDDQGLYDDDDLDEDSFSTLFVTGLIGYRYQKPGRGFQFRAVGVPTAGDGEFFPWAGVSFGYAW